MTQKRKIPGGENIYLYSLIGGGIGVLISSFLILLSPFVLIKTQNPNSISAITAFACLFIGSFVSSFLTAFRFGSDTIKLGLFIGLAMLLIIFPISLFIKGEFDVLGALINVTIIMVSTFLGGYLIHRLNTNQKRSMKKVMRRR